MSDSVTAAVVADLESRRSAADGTMAADRVVVEWIGPGAAPFRVRKRDFEFVVDEPTERGGTDTFRDISYDVRIETDEPAERIRDLAERADVMCFASNTLANAGVTLTTRIFVNGVATATLDRNTPG